MSNQILPYPLPNNTLKKLIDKISIIQISQIHRHTHALQNASIKIEEKIVDRRLAPVLSSLNKKLSIQLKDEEKRKARVNAKTRVDAKTG